MEYLEQLIAEWHEYQGYFVNRNLWVGLQEDGSYECELDIVAFHPTKNRIIHIEPSLDSSNWDAREEHFRTKFEAGKKYLHRMFVAHPSPRLEQIALLVFAHNLKQHVVDGARIMLLPELLDDIFNEIASYDIASNLLPEQWPLLRTLQFVAEYRQTVCDILQGVS